MVSAQLGEEFQDADARDSRPARLPPRRERRLPAFHHVASDGRGVKNAVLPRRRPLGAEAAECEVVVRNGQCLGGSVDEVVAPAHIGTDAFVRPTQPRFYVGRTLLSADRLPSRLILPSVHSSSYVGRPPVSAPAYRPWISTGPPLWTGTPLTGNSPVPSSSPATNGGNS